MTREEVLEIRDRLQERMNDLGEELDMKITVGRAKFSTSATFSIEVAPIAESGQALTREVEDFKRLAARYGLQPSDLGRVFAFQGAVYTVEGLNPRSRKYPIRARRRSDERVFRFQGQHVQQLLMVNVGN